MTLPKNKQNPVLKAILEDMKQNIDVSAYAFDNHLSFWFYYKKTYVVDKLIVHTKFKELFPIKEVKKYFLMKYKFEHYQNTEWVNKVLHEINHANELIKITQTVNLVWKEKPTNEKI